MKNLLAFSLIIVIGLSGCRDGDGPLSRDCEPACINGGTCDKGVCDCPSGFSGDHCQTDLRSKCQRDNTGQLYIKNQDLQEYKVYLDGTYRGTLDFYQSATFEVRAGWVDLKFEKQLLWSGVVTDEVYVEQCGLASYFIDD